MIDQYDLACGCLQWRAMGDVHAMDSLSLASADELRKLIGTRTARHCAALIVELQRPVTGGARGALPTVSGAAAQRY